jgi:biotin carboxylase
MDINLLLVGFNTGVLDVLDRAGIHGVVVLEEPDLWRNKGLAAKAPLHPCLADVRLATYQQSEGYLEVAEELRGRVRSVAPGLEYAVVAAAHLAETLGLPGAGLPAARLLRDKIELRRAQVGSGLREVAHREVRSVAEVEAFLAEHASIVLKPANRQASLGVQLLTRGDDLVTAWQECTEADEGRQLAGRSMRWRYLVEERLAGREVSVEALVREGRVLWTNLTHKSTLAGPSPVEVGHVVGFPAGRWPDRMQRFVDAIGYRTGILHAEWMVEGDEVSLIECAGRPPGDHITELIDLAYDDTLCARWIRLMQGADDNHGLAPARGAAVRFLVPSRPGLVTAVSGADEARSLPGVRQLEVTVEPGAEVGLVTSSWDRLGHVIATGVTPEEADQRARRAVEAVEIRISPAASPRG